MIDPGLYQSRFGPAGRFAKRVLLRGLRFILLRQAELEARVHAVERWLPALESSRVMAREANAGLIAISARLTALQQENETVRQLAETALRNASESVASADLAIQDLGSRLQRTEERQQGGNERTDEVVRRLDAITGADERIAEIVNRLDAIAFEITQLRSRLSITPYMSESIESWTPAVHSAPGAFDYVGFEQIFRGPESLIRERQRAYLPIVRDLAPVLDVGCGRGEFLELLAGEKIDAVGVDSNPQMIAHCVAKGLPNAIEADALAYLRDRTPGSLGSIFSAQVVEHLEPDDLLAFVSLAHERLRSGGAFIAETVNPNSIEGAKTFYVDASHVKPIFPETFAFLCKSVGFTTVRIFYPNGGGFDEKEPTLQPEFAVVATR